jgi:glyoxylase-like metal-dependent hydrolase (beta-lactamase superfamily II)/ketosteroid isomerase-like protein
MGSAELIAEYLDAVMRKDASAVERYFDPNIEYLVNGAPMTGSDGTLAPLSPACHAALPWLGLYRGRKALEGFLAHMHRNLDVIAFGPREVIAQGEKAAAFGWFRLRALATGRTADIAYSIHVELRDNRIIKYHFLENTFDVAVTFHAGGWWLMNTDGTLHRVPREPLPSTETTAPALTIQTFSSSEAGAWSNAYLVSQGQESVLFDVPMLRADAEQLASMVQASSSRLTAVIVSHAHPDHFMGLDVITERFPEARVLSTPRVVADVAEDGPAMFALLKGRLGPAGPSRLVVPEPLTDLRLQVGSSPAEVVEFEEGESKHTAALHLPGSKALLCADLVYNGAHLYVAERHIDGWLTRLDELEQYAAGRVTTLYPGHGLPGDLRLVADTRAYLRDFADAIGSGTAAAAEQQMLARYPMHRVKQFLTMFSLPAFFPAASTG